MSVYSTILFIIIIVEFSLAVVIFLGSRRLSAKVFTVLILLHTIWAISETILHKTTDPALASFLITYSHYLGGIIANVFVYFTLSFPENKLPKQKILIGFVLLQTILLFLYGNGLVVEKAFPITETPQLWGWHWGSLWFIFHLTFFGFWLTGLYILYKKLHKAIKKDRKGLAFMFFAMLISVVPISVITIIFPIFDTFKHSWIGSISSLGWVSIFAYLIIKQLQMNVRAVLAKIFVLAASIILFVSVFMGQDDANTGIISSETIIRTTVFFAFFVVGYLLIINILKESEQKEKIERLNKELETLNVKLEEKVEERTQELNVSKNHIETILENLTLGIVEYNSDFTISQINKAAEQLLGVKRENVAGKKISPGETEKLSSLAIIIFGGRTKKGILDLGEQGITYKEVTIKYPKTKELQVITVPIRNIPFIEVSGFVKLLRDVTHEKEVARSKNEFISIVAHQLNAPLHAAQWSLETVIKEEKNEKRKDFLNKAYSTNKNLIQITSDLLTATLIDSGEFNFNFRKNDIVESITKQISEFKNIAKQKGLHLVFKNNQPDIPKFMFDQEKINTALKHVIGNATDYTPKGGNITITLDVLSSGCVVITIRDTGIGIAKEELGEIFVKFHRSKQALLMETDRSGLGLYITKKIVDGHKGVITIKSKEGEGVKVQIQLPIPDSLPAEKQDNQ